METARQSTGHDASDSGAYLTDTDMPVRRHGAGGRVTGDGLEREVDLEKARRADKLAQRLGWFSIGLGAAQILAPASMSRLIGVKDAGGNKLLMRALGVREISAGLGLLADPKPTGFAVARVAGDVMDLALLANVLSTPENDRGRAAFAAAAVMGVGLLDLFASEQLAATVPKVAHPAKDSRTIRVKRAVTVRRSPEEVYAFWRNFENLPQFMTHLDSVQNTGEGRSRWKAGSSEGMSVEWDVEIVEDRVNELISWRTIGVSDLTGHGTVEFRTAPGGRGTEVRADIGYQPPGGALGAKIARLLRDVPGVKIENQLNVFKEIVETGEQVRSDASIHKGPHPAQPPADRVSFGATT